MEGQLSRRGNLRLCGFRPSLGLLPEFHRKNGSQSLSGLRTGRAVLVSVLSGLSAGSPAFRYMADREEACQALQQTEAALSSASKVKRAGKLLLSSSLLLFLDGAGTRLIPTDQIVWTAVRKSRSAVFFCAAASDGKRFRFSCPSYEAARELEQSLRAQNPGIADGDRPPLSRRKHKKEKHRRS